MPIIRRPGWKLPESAATSETVFLNRRTLIGGGLAAAAGLGAGVAALSPAAWGQRAAEVPDPSAGLYPFKRNEKYVLDRPLTPEDVNANYNNFFEFGTSKNIARAAQALRIRPWTIKVDGLVARPREIGVDELMKAMPLEERLYRMRCVEAWSMTIPWSGFALDAFVKWAEPLGSAKYVRFETFLDPRMAPGQRQSWYPWPYVEGLTMAEATNELAFLVTGTYGKPAAKQHGAPLRLAVPWKYGFKSIKSITRISFTKERPKGYWEAAQGAEYGFWANVNPAAAHPRWSQATEEILGTRERRPTLIFNGYGDYVAGLYKGLENERLWA